jgi:hypothetical protein
MKCSEVLASQFDRTPMLLGIYAHCSVFKRKSTIWLFHVSIYLIECSKLRFLHGIHMDNRSPLIVDLKCSKLLKRYFWPYGLFTLFLWCEKRHTYELVMCTIARSVNQKPHRIHICIINEPLNVSGDHGIDSVSTTVRRGVFFLNIRKNTGSPMVKRVSAQI